MTGGRFLLVLGGARSGKSDFATGRAAATGDQVFFVATATPLDDDMAARIRRHRADRPAEWGLVEAPVRVAEAIAGIDAGAPDPLVVVDCLTTWTSNLLLEGFGEVEIQERATVLGDLLAGRSGRSIVVSNEVGLGVHPETELGRSYRDVLGRVNQAVAARADRTVFLAAGRAVELHDPAGLLDGWW